MNFSTAPTSIAILLADDREEDRMMTRAALEDFVANERRVEDGEELLDDRQRRGNYSEAKSSPRPDLLLLDLKVPRKSGLEALAEAKADPSLRRISVVVSTTSQHEVDNVCSYDVGVSSFLFKPVTFAGLVEVTKTSGGYRTEIVVIPQSGESE